MRAESTIAEELSRLEQAWPDEAGKRYRNNFLQPMRQMAEELRCAMEEFESELPSRPLNPNDY